MNVVVLFLAILVGLVLEVALPTAAWLAQTTPPFLICVALYYALRRPLPLLLAIIVMGGAAADSLGALPLGCTTLALAVLLLPIHAQRDIISSGQWHTEMILGALTGGGLVLIQGIVLWLYGFALAPGWLGLKILVTAFYGLLLAPFVLRFLAGLDSMAGNLQEEAL